MIRPSEELKAVIRRWHEAIVTKDEPTLTNMLSRSEHLRYQGTAEGEEWAGQVFRRGFPDHVSEIPDFTSRELSLEAFENGPVGWAHFHAELTFHDTRSTSLHRFTFVLTLEDGTWRIMQVHVSNPTSNIEKMGVEHQALDDLIRAAREAFSLDQTEGIATIMFTDIANSSTLAELLGDRTWSQAVRAHFAEARHAVETNGGQWVKSLGDGTMSSFPSARAALQAAITLQRGNTASDREPHLGLRIGLHSGDVIQTEDDFFGTVVNKSARIAAAAGPDEILASDATRIMAGPDRFTFEARRTTALKGLPGDHLVHRVAWRG